ncbi:unnamed protein product, partial [marine sediment metagenome]
TPPVNDYLLSLQRSGELQNTTISISGLTEGGSQLLVTVEDKDLEDLQEEHYDSGVLQFTRPL